MFANPMNAFSQEIKVGDIIAYPVRRGSAMHMTFGLVEHLAYRENLFGVRKFSAKIRKQGRVDRLYNFSNFSNAIPLKGSQLPDSEEVQILLQASSLIRRRLRAKK